MLLCTFFVLESFMALTLHYLLTEALIIILNFDLNVAVVSPSVHLPIYLPIYLSFYLSIYLSTYLSIYLSIYLPISLLWMLRSTKDISAFATKETAPNTYLVPQCVKAGQLHNGRHIQYASNITPLIWSHLILLIPPKAKFYIQHTYKVNASPEPPNFSMKQTSFNCCTWAKVSLHHWADPTNAIIVGDNTQTRSPLGLQVKQLTKICWHLICSPNHPRLLGWGRFKPCLRPVYFLL